MSDPVVTWDDRVAAWLFAETDTHYIHILPMIFNHRVVTTPKDRPTTYDHGWCYPDFNSAIAACLVWQRRGFADEPTGYLKRIAMNGRRA